jgi:FKBP-type peptidyl-prolyl cis-trans isomerase 2
MSQAKSGDTVTVHYTGRLTDGTVFDTSSGGEPLKFTLGQNRVISGFEHAVLGMAPGEKKTAVVPSTHAYGNHRTDLVVEFQRQQMPDEIKLQVGQAIQLQAEGGQKLTARVIDLSSETVTLDANHPLAGQDLTFDIELVEIPVAS